MMIRLASLRPSFYAINTKRHIHTYVQTYMFVCMCTALYVLHCNQLDYIVWYCIVLYCILICCIVFPVGLYFNI